MKLDIIHVQQLICFKQYKPPIQLTCGHVDSSAAFGMAFSSGVLLKSRNLETNSWQ